jgi:hypothetical protein
LLYTRISYLTVFCLYPIISLVKVYTNVNPQFTKNKTASCDAAGTYTVLGLLQDISQKVSNIEVLLGGGSASTSGFHHKPRGSDVSGCKGIDIVLGAQWGDEGKGKLVDILSQVGVAHAVLPAMQSGHCQ